MTIYTSDNKLILVAHRGIATYFPENTMIAFKAALISDIDILEIDIHRTLDNQLVVIHDDSIDRTSNGSGKIKDMTLAALQQFDYGITKDNKFEGETLPTLDEVIKLIQDYPQKLLIELKQPQNYPEIENELIDALNAWNLPKNKVIIQSFNQKSMKTIFDMNEGYELGVLISKKKYWYKLPPFKSIAAYANYVNPNYALVTEKFLKSAHQYRLSVMPYTVNEHEQAKSLQKLGVDGLISDNPNDIL
ncbi:MAG: glycerophosphodiester phosphodiesterase [Staphylococcus equorum]|uniref:glycerophosphodiester phosphodiesterase n=1 Tax=Staphylococcus TaxID=1279 RepID=UPI000623CF25|nr:glycerophosphodiester phosphodiesterase family protein [Staphylococcus equorum]KKI54613.1 Glycerophosphoryl diester phosphodiesterase [Staphylococcus equorum subsp. equorum]MDG0838286.1 glycerophosphodiester phosphodiesterase [Staphylococcus equorum]MDK9871102.1 glycerophosphodiester phosphodiesterase family protein [Staphylococcus equorum]MDK9876499.1 glycerophosphodiester phosphodiesterase family protein [Staphylococcus equorum]MDN5829010.1 glycerophosphodiester phosphodiesterase [Staphyl